MHARLPLLPRLLRATALSPAGQTRFHSAGRLMEPVYGGGEGRMVVVAVSGTLQEGFPLRKNLDYHDELTGELRHAAEFLGWGLCRGMKSYFDVKDAACREHGGYTAVNPALVPTNNPLHANISAIYLVHEKAALNALLGEPRLLSMAPDVARVDLTTEETSDAVKQLAAAAIARDETATNAESIALLTVVSTAQATTFVDNPVLYTKEDGTEVTNFHDGLAKLCGTTEQARLETPDEYYAAVESTLKRLEQPSGWSTIHGTDKSTLRLNQRFTAAEFEALRQHPQRGAPI